MPTIVLRWSRWTRLVCWRVSAEADLPDQMGFGSDIKVSVFRNTQIRNSFLMFTNRLLLQIDSGSLLLQALLEHWSLTHIHSTAGEFIKGNEYFQVPKRTLVIFRYECLCCLPSTWFLILVLFVRSEIGGRTICRILIRDATGENESVVLHETVTSWVAETVIEKTPPKFLKIPIYVLPHTSANRMEKGEP